MVICCEIESYGQPATRLPTGARRSGAGQPARGIHEPDEFRIVAQAQQVEVVEQDVESAPAEAKEPVHDDDEPDIAAEEARSAEVVGEHGRWRPAR